MQINFYFLKPLHTRGPRATPWASLGLKAMFPGINGYIGHEKVCLQTLLAIIMLMECEVILYTDVR